VVRRAVFPPLLQAKATLRLQVRVMRLQQADGEVFGAGVGALVRVMRGLADAALVKRQVAVAKGAKTALLQRKTPGWLHVSLSSRQPWKKRARSQSLLRSTPFNNTALSKHNARKDSTMRPE